MFHVPESARVLHHPQLGSDASFGNNGAFTMASPEPGWGLVIIASDGDDPDVPESAGWEHVSVHAENRNGKNRTPTWKEMCFVKDLFWEPEDVVMQLHPRKSEYVSFHDFTLHLWRSRTQPIPEPPSMLVGPKA